jgi:hypothetical protein
MGDGGMFSVSACDESAAKLARWWFAQAGDHTTVTILEVQLAALLSEMAQATSRAALRALHRQNADGGDRNHG